MWCRCEISSPLAENCTAEREDWNSNCIVVPRILCTRKSGRIKNGVYIFLELLQCLELMPPDNKNTTFEAGTYKYWYRGSHISIVTKRKVTNCTDLVEGAKSLQCRCAENYIVTFIPSSSLWLSIVPENCSDAFFWT